MNGLLKRDRFESRAAEVRRLVAIAVVTMALATTWHVIRGGIVQRLGMASVGHSGHATFLARSLGDAGIDGRPVVWLVSSSLPRPGWVWWHVGSVEKKLDGLGSLVVPKQSIVADGRFRVRGKLPGDVYLAEAPTDIDGDGWWEVLVMSWQQNGSKTQFIQYDAVLRMKESANEIIWLGRVDGSRGFRLYPTWEDDNKGETQGLRYLRVALTRGPSGKVVPVSTETVGVFKIDRPGGLLRTEVCSEDCGIVPWDPPDGGPISVDQLTDLGPVVEKLLPLPAD